MDKPTIKVAKVPRATRELMARMLLEKAVAYFQQPGVEEDFQEWLKGYEARKAATQVAGT